MTTDTSEQGLESLIVAAMAGKPAPATAATSAIHAAPAEIPAKVAADEAHQNAMKNSDRQNARIEHDKALQRAMIFLIADHTELFKQFSDNESFKKWLQDMVFGLTYEPPEKAA